MLNKVVNNANLINFYLSNSNNVKFFSNYYDKTLLMYSGNIFSEVYNLFLRLSSFYYSSNLVDNFAYNTPYNGIKKYFKGIKKKLNISTLLNSLDVYVSIFSILASSVSIFIFNIPSIVLSKSKGIKSTIYNKIKTSEHLFLNSNWSEREVSEMNNISFLFKIDNRNLLLIYGEMLNPILKKHPSIGYLEYSYILFLDLISKSYCSNY